MMSLQDHGLEQHYQEFFSMYSSPGWKAVQEQIVEMFALHNTLSGVSTTEELHFRRGQLDIMSFLISHQDQHERAYNEMIATQQGTEPDAPTGGVARVVEGEDGNPFE